MNDPFEIRVEIEPETPEMAALYSLWKGPMPIVYKMPLQQAMENFREHLETLVEDMAERTGALPTLIAGKRFRCPRCGGDKVRDFTTHAKVTSQILRFDVMRDGRVSPDNETKYELEDFCEGSTSEYECDNCGLPLDVYELPAMVAEEDRHEKS